MWNKIGVDVNILQQDSTSKYICGTVTVCVDTRDISVTLGVTQNRVVIISGLVVLGHASVAPTRFFLGVIKKKKSKIYQFPRKQAELIRPKMLKDTKKKNAQASECSVQSCRNLETPGTRSNELLVV